MGTGLNYNLEDVPGSSASSSGSGRHTEQDSGYGGSVIVDESDELIEDKPFDFTPDVTSTDGNLQRSWSIGAQRDMSLQMNQLQYNNNRVLLGRSISVVLKLLGELQMINRTWPVYYPVSGGSANSGASGAQNGETSLVVPKREFGVFKLDLKFGTSSATSDDVVKKLERESIGSLVDNKIQQIIKHLGTLRERIDDTASKVLVTGDLNAGKSTFCNALLRKKVLPEDQQPCTNVFCEVRDSTENNGIEQVHAVFIGKTYDRSDEATYQVFEIKDLDDLVYEVNKYSLLKVYVDDSRPPHQSLLRNGVVDISLIDAPGLNLDSFQTTQLFSRQEEIDLVVFVVSAENHFTLSARDFISNAAHEKSFIFIVVNRFDNIQDKSRCMERILTQVQDLSPETHKDAREFVHFVSSKKITDSLGGGGGGGGGDDDNDDGDDNNNNDNNSANDPNFDRLEDSLRDFVLEKRSLSKLAPAKTYLNNLLLDLESLAEANIQVTANERAKYLESLDQLSPSVDKSVNESIKVNTKVDNIVESLCDDTYKYTFETLTNVINDIGRYQVAPYSSFLDIYTYAWDTRDAFIKLVHNSVAECEQYARNKAITSVNSIKSLGILHLGDQPAFNKLFKHEAMFSKRRDSLARSISSNISLSDFIDISLPSLPWPITQLHQNTAISSKDDLTSTASNALTLASVVGGSRLILQSDWVSNAFRAVGLVDFGMIKKFAIPITILMGAWGLVYVISDIPNALPRKMARKIRKEIESIDYTRANADRISKECRKVLRYPQQDIIAAFQSSIEKKVRDKEDCAKSVRKADTAYHHFSQFHMEAAQQRVVLSQINLDSPVIESI